MKVFHAKSPTRVDLAGGTLDLWPLNCFVENCVTINVAINIYTECELKIRDDKKIIISSTDQKFCYEFANLSSLLFSSEKALKFFQTHVGYWGPNWGFELTTNSNSPLGGGLGGSSSLSISVMKCFAQAFNKNFGVVEMATVAHNLEAAILRTPTGIQDYVPAIQPGMNLISFNSGGFKVERLSVSPDFFNDHALLVYTGRPHHSGLNNFEVMKSAVAGNEVTINALRGIRDTALELKEKIRQQNLGDLKDVLNKEYDFRIQLTPAFTSPEIERLRTITLQNGGDAIKICGAGGGGCVMVWGDPKVRSRLRTAIEAASFQILDAKAINE